MILIQGKGVSRGVVKGPLYFYKKPDTTVVKIEVKTVSRLEKYRLLKRTGRTIRIAALWVTTTSRRA